MKIQILFFGILKDIVGNSSIEFTLNPTTTIRKLKGDLLENHPKLNDFANFSIAVNEEYVEAEYELQQNDIVALIPPVSGG